VGRYLTNKLVPATSSFVTRRFDELQVEPTSDTEARWTWRGSQADLGCRRLTRCMHVSFQTLVSPLAGWSVLVSEVANDESDGFENQSGDDGVDDVLD
jgi:hypothetical protein